MPRDPKASRIVDVEPEWRYMVVPGVGPRAVRYVTYEDGTKELRYTDFRNAQQESQEGELPATAGTPVPQFEVTDSKVAGEWQTRQRLENPHPTPKTPEEQTRQRQEIDAATKKAGDEDRERKEKEWNLQHPGADGKGYYETNQERATRERQDQANERAEEARQQALRTEQRNAENQTRQNELAQGNLEISRGNLTLAQQREEREANKPTFLSQATDDNPYLIRYNPESGLVESMSNPNFDQVKQESERLRSLIAVQIQAKQLDLETGKAKYQQWYDTNVKIPMLQAQEARDKAAEQRAALDAEERRRQFASNFSLQKAELGQRAGAAAMQAEESLLPYRAGPTESAEMSSAINSLASGGSMANNASAGIHFTPGAFEFDAPDFKSIAKQAAAAALKGISTYKPSGDAYATADYSGVPAVNTSGAPDPTSSSSGFEGIINQLKSTYNFGGPQG